MRVNFTVNGRPQEADDVWEGESLLYVLRERLGLPGSKNACEQGECGSCTVYLDGTPVCACLVAAGQAQGREVTTVEGLAGEELVPVHQAFVAQGAVPEGVRALGAYDRWIGMSADPSVRAALAELREATRDGSPVWAQIRQIGDDLQRGLLALLYETGLSPLTRPYGLF